MQTPLDEEGLRKHKDRKKDFAEIKNSERKAVAQSHWITDQTDLGFKPSTLKHIGEL